jgi:hypothetical protein
MKLRTWSILLVPSLKNESGAMIYTVGADEAVEREQRILIQRAPSLKECTEKVRVVELTAQIEAGLRKAGLIDEKDNTAQAEPAAHSQPTQPTTTTNELFR